MEPLCIIHLHGPPCPCHALSEHPPPLPVEPSAAVLSSVSEHGSHFGGWGEGNIHLAWGPERSRSGSGRPGQTQRPQDPLGVRKPHVRECGKACGACSPDQAPAPHPGASGPTSARCAGSASAAGPTATLISGVHRRSLRLRRVRQALSQSSRLVIHGRTGDGPTSASCAGKRFNNSSHFSAHRRAARAKHCPACGRGFREGTDLRKHQRTHGREQPLRRPPGLGLRRALGLIFPGSCRVVSFLSQLPISGRLQTLFLGPV